MREYNDAFNYAIDNLRRNIGLSVPNYNAVKIDEVVEKDRVVEPDDVLKSSVSTDTKTEIENIAFESEEELSDNAVYDTDMEETIPEQFDSEGEDNQNENIIPPEKITDEAVEMYDFDAKKYLKQNGAKLRRSSIIFGIIAIVSSISVVFGVLFGLIAIILNAFSRTAAHKNCTTVQKNMLKKHEKAGFILGIIAIIISIVWFVILAISFIFYFDFSGTVGMIFPEYTNVEYLKNAVDYIQDIMDSINAYWSN